MIHQNFDTATIPAAGTDISMVGVETVFCDNDGAPKHSKVVSLLTLLKKARLARDRASRHAA